jgi:HAD superfamily hydrolase (TIGR01509 family)
VVRDPADAPRGPALIAILDIDGTLVDTNYQHTIAWHRALRQHDARVAAWRIHRHIGMGGDKIVAALCGDEFEAEHGDDVRAAEKVLYMEMIGEVEPFDGARGLIEDLKGGGDAVVLASSAKPNEVEHYLDLLDARELMDAWTDSGDVEETKPAPDLVRAALDKVQGSHDEAVMVGDTPWDVKAADAVDVPTVAVLTGGFSAAELREAGAVAVFEGIQELRRVGLGIARVGQET